MARTPSQMIALGTLAPDFSLPDPDGTLVSLSAFSKGKCGTLVIFMCNHCPYVIHIAPKLAELTANYMKMGLAVVGINSNDTVNFPEDSPAKMKIEKEARGYLFPYLFDESQSVARSYGAACTPDFFLYDKNLRLAYRGQFDDSRPGNGIPVTGSDLSSAVHAVASSQTPSPEQRPSLGCNIKWKP